MVVSPTFCNYNDNQEKKKTLKNSPEKELKHFHANQGLYCTIIKACAAKPSSKTLL